MHSSTIVEDAASTLAKTMRLYVEAYLRFADLFKIDPEEAIDNIDRAFEAKLEAFHSLYDVSKTIFAYFDHGDTALIIAIRNAIHHLNHPLFRSFRRRLHLEEGGVNRWLGASFLLASHPTLHGAPVWMAHHVRLDDMDSRLDPSRTSPYLDTGASMAKIASRFELIDRQLALPAIRRFRDRHRFPNDQAYVDLMPIFVSAACKVFNAMKHAGIGFNRFDARTYLTPFKSELEIDLGNHDFRQLRMRGWGPLDLVPIPVE